MARFTVEDLELEKAHEPFEVELGDGSIYLLQDPKEMALEDLVRLESLSPLNQVKAVIADGKFEEFAGHPEVTGRFFSAVMAKYMKHFGLGSPPNVSAS
jgi:hypothetical protein